MECIGRRPMWLSGPFKSVKTGYQKSVVYLQKKEKESFFFFFFCIFLKKVIQIISKNDLYAKIS